jgi:hypothetical protein
MAAPWSLTLTFSPEAVRTMAKFAAMPERLPRAIMAGLDAALEVGYQQALKTNFTGKGPFPVSEKRLGVRTGLLRTSFRRSPSRLEGAGITAAIGSKTKYWFSHEFGFDGQVSVAAHTRQTALNEKGAPVRVRTARRSKKPHTFRTGNVSAHKRTLRIPERAPMRTGLTTQLPEMNRILGGVIIRDLNGGPAK